MGEYDEQTLIATARSQLGSAEDVLAAGVFGLASLAGAQVAGSIAGAVIESDAVPLSVALGGIAAKKAAAEARGITIQLIVAVTPDAIHVLNRDTGGRLADEAAVFPRGTTTVDVEPFGLSRHITLTADGHSLTLHGTVSWLSPLAKGDKLVLALIDDPA